MKNNIGLTTFLLLLAWLGLTLGSGYYWIQKLYLAQICLVFSIFLGLYWMTNKENRTKLFSIFRTRDFSTLFESLNNGGFAAYFVALFIVVATFIQSLAFSISNSEAFTHLSEHIQKDQRIQEKIGAIQLVSLAGSYKLNSSSKGQNLSGTVIVFGEQGNVKFQATSSGKNEDWIVSYNLK